MKTKKIRKKTHLKEGNKLYQGRKTLCNKKYKKTKPLLNIKKKQNFKGGNNENNENTPQTSQESYSSAENSVYEFKTTSIIDLIINNYLINKENNDLLNEDLLIRMNRLFDINNDNLFYSEQNLNSYFFDSNIPKRKVEFNFSVNPVIKSSQRGEIFEKENIFNNFIFEILFIDLPRNLKNCNKELCIELLKKYIENQLNKDIRRQTYYINDNKLPSNINNIEKYRFLLHDLINDKQFANNQDINNLINIIIILSLQNIFNFLHGIIQLIILKVYKNIFENYLNNNNKFFYINPILNGNQYIKLIIDENDLKIIIYINGNFLINFYINYNNELIELDEPQRKGNFSSNLTLDLLNKTYNYDLDFNLDFDESRENFEENKENDVIEQNSIQQSNSLNPYIKYGVPSGLILTGLGMTPYLLALFGGKTRKKHKIKNRKNPFFQKGTKNIKRKTI